ncbi:hypothetical protein [Labrys wisconsinensis]|uniref:Uncharacterized protein n=1 Tax=Labrys wisconsinensis TaxID=425677 RepID=A0ABU0JHE6_9HYPH|nr:hypothetical protein [Labrys wisconsinensis]MDQ0472906.1 hypothetical protein [Labrys wisconsinensis]
MAEPGGRHKRELSIGRISRRDRAAPPAVAKPIAPHKVGASSVLRFGGIAKHRKDASKQGESKAAFPSKRALL